MSDSKDESNRVVSSSSFDDVDSDGDCSYSYLVIARHGERLDYVVRDAGGNWIKAPTTSRPWDPPLSDHGKKQAFKLGTHLASELRNKGLPPLSAVYTSPFLRCRQTAVAVVMAYNRGVQNAAGRAVAGPQDGRTDGATKSTQLPPACVEYGLSESINESWYRSWAMPYSDGTWGMRAMGEYEIDPASLHPASKEAVQTILMDWRTVHNGDDNTREHMNIDYVARTAIEPEYTFYPRNLESSTDQQWRMKHCAETLTDSMPGRTVLVVSHGGPMAHLFQELTHKGWKAHGETSYCCYTIYRRRRRRRRRDDQKDDWTPLAVNQADYLNEEIVKERHI